MSSTPKITQSDLDTLMEENVMSNPTGYCYTCEELFHDAAEPDAENYLCDYCDNRTLHGAMRVADDTMFGALRVVETANAE